MVKTVFAMPSSAKRVWDAAVILLPTRGLEKLLSALKEDSPTILQGATTTPPPLQCVQNWDVEAACLVGYCGWKSDEIGETVGEVEEFFARWCFEADQLMGEPGACRWLLNWYDDTPRNEMRAILIPLVREELNRRYKNEMCLPGQK